MALLKFSIIIVAAGRGNRAKTDIPKQFVKLKEMSMLEHSLKAFAVSKDQIIVVHNENDTQWIAPLQEVYPSVTWVTGGETRSASVANGLKALSLETTHVLIHDAARPLVSQEVIQGVKDALQNAQAAAPGIAVVDTLWQSEKGLITGAQDRAGLYQAQTPQGFERSVIEKAHAACNLDMTDDVQAVQRLGIFPHLSLGATENFKVTLPDDFKRAEQILESRAQKESTQMDIRVGNGFDVHRFGAGDHVMLCGVKIAHHRGLQGHSDADVGLHTITDALYGALAQGDIGRHFPPSDPQWKGMDSAVFLEHAVQLARQMGYTISNIDCTLMCEHPKIGPHAQAMISRVAQITALAEDRISIKATTTERLGFTGRSEGIACMGTVTVIKP